MILTTGKDGVTDMYNDGTKTRWYKMFIHKRLEIRGPITTQGARLNLGYNEVIMCDSEGTAEKLATKIMKDLNR